MSLDNDWPRPRYTDHHPFLNVACISISVSRGVAVTNHTINVSTIPTP